MKNYITTYNAFQYFIPIDFKRDVLFFDRVNLHDGNMLLANPLTNMVSEESTEVYNNNRKTIEFLYEKQLFAPFSVDTATDLMQKNINNIDEARANEMFESFKKIKENIENNIYVPKTGNIAMDKFNLALNRLNALNLVDVRYWALILSTIKAGEYYSPFQNNNNNLTGISKKEQVIMFLFNKIPVIDSSASWEEIIEYKSDKDVQRKYFALINWANEVANTNLSISEIKDKFEYLYREYEYQLNLHKKKKSTTTFQVIINSPLEAIENLVKLNFGKVLSPFFNISKGNMDLLEAETKITGRELGYIFDVKEKFRK